MTLDEPFSVEVRAPVRNVDNQIRGVGTLFDLRQNGGVVEATNGVLDVRGSETDHTGVFAASPGGVLEMEANVTGSGAWSADGGRIHIAGNVGTTGDIEVLHGGSLAVDTQMSGRNLVVDSASSLDVQGALRLAGNVDFDGAHNSRELRPGWLFRNHGWARRRDRRLE